MIVLLSSTDSPAYFPGNQPAAFTSIAPHAVLNSGSRKGWTVAVKDVSFELSSKHEEPLIFDISLSYAEGCMIHGSFSDIIARVHCTPYKGKWVTASFDTLTFHPMNVNQIELFNILIKPVNTTAVSLASGTATHVTLVLRQEDEHQQKTVV